MHDTYQDFRARSAEIVVVTASPLYVAERIARAVDAPFPILADVDHRVVKEYGVYGLTADDTVSPAVFIVGSNRQIVWSYVGQYPTDQPRAQEILEHLPTGVLSGFDSPV